MKFEAQDRSNVEDISNQHDEYLKIIPKCIKNLIVDLTQNDSDLRDNLLNVLEGINNSTIRLGTANEKMISILSDKILALEKKCKETEGRLTFYQETDEQKREVEIQNDMMQKQLEDVQHQLKSKKNFTK